MRPPIYDHSQVHTKIAVHEREGGETWWEAGGGGGREGAIVGSA